MVYWSGGEKNIEQTAGGSLLPGAAGIINHTKTFF